MKNRHPAEEQIRAIAYCQTNEHAFQSESEGKGSQPDNVGTMKNDRMGVGYSATTVQRELFIAQTVSGGSTYNIAFIARLPKGIDAQQWQEALKIASADQDILFCSLENMHGEVMHVLRDKKISFAFIDCRHLDYSAVQEYVAARRDVEIDFAHAPMVHHFLFSLPEDEYASALIAPHAIFDGYSAKLFFEQVGANYCCLDQNQLQKRIRRAQFFDYAESLNGRFDLPATKWHWRNALKSCGVIDGNPIANTGTFVADSFTLSPADVTRIKEYCAKRKIHLPSFFLAVYGLVAKKYVSDGDLAVYSIVGTRPKEYIKTIGCFYRIVPYVIPDRLLTGTIIEELLRFLEEYIRTVSDTTFVSSSYINSITPQGEIKLLFNYLRYNLIRVADVDGVMDEFWEHPENEVHLLINDVGNAIDVQLFFHTRRFNDRQLLQRLKHVIFQIALSGSPHDRLDFFLPHERLVAEHGSRTVPISPSYSSVLSRFVQHACAVPGNTALRYQGRDMTYGDLLLDCRRFATKLRNQGVSPGSRVVICLEPSPHMIVAVLATLLSGAVYVPINTRYPAQRVLEIMTEVQPDLVVTQSSLESLVAADFPIVKTDMDCWGEEDAAGTIELPPGPGAEDPAYIIYTSGTSGRPKGVVVTHGNISRLFTAADEYYQFSINDRWSLFHSISFDFSVWEMWGALAFGGVLVLVPEETARSPELFYRFACNERITVLNQTPSSFYALQQVDGREGGRLDTLRYVIFGGELLAPRKIAPWIERHGDQTPQLYNMYGITETTVHVTCRRLCREDTALAGANFIGRPLRDLAVNVVDRNLVVLPPGFVGELCISGAGVASGYFNRPDLDADRFRVEPALFGGNRFYRSGDLGRVLPNGELEYLGRLDSQIKVRGFRIEPAEIEIALLKQAGISGANIVATDIGRGDQGEPGDRQLIAYLLSDGIDRPTPDNLKTALGRLLPDYMIPAAYVYLDAFPLNDNGKIDTKSLPPPTRQSFLSPGYVKPRTKEEELFTQLFTEILGVEPVGIHDNFFQLGGHSLAVTQLIGRYQHRTGRTIPLCTVFQSPTPAELAERSVMIDRMELSPLLYSCQMPHNKQAMPLSFSQERVWLLLQLSPENRAYEFLSVLDIRGPLAIAVLEESLQLLVDRHEIYRSTFHEVAGIPHQTVHPHMVVNLERIDRLIPPQDLAAGETALGQVIDEITAVPFKLGVLPLARWKIVRFSESHHVLIHFEHHLLHDGWSFVVFLKELLIAYESLSQRRPPPLPTLQISFTEYVARHRIWLASVEQQQLGYWKNRLKGMPFGVPLPFDFPRADRQTFRGAAIRHKLPMALFTRLSSTARSLGATWFMMMIGAFGVLLAKYSRQRDFVIGTSFANRRWKETEHLLGMLINNLPFRFNIDIEQTVRELIADIRRDTIDAAEHQDLPFNRLVEELNPPRTPDMNPIFQILFTAYEGPMPEIHIPGLEIELKEGLNTGSAKFDLNVIAIAQQDEATTKKEAGTSAEPVLIIWEYNTALYSRTTMEKMLACYIKTLEFMATSPSSLLKEMRWTSIEEASQLLVWGNDSAHFHKEGTVIERFAEVAGRRPHAIAVKYGERKISYRQLDRSSERLAARLSAAGVRPGNVVAVSGPRCPEMVQAFLAILKAGGVYLPLDGRSPDDRKISCLSEAGAVLLLSVGGEPHGEATFSLPVLRIVEVPDCLEEGVGQRPLPSRVQDSEPAYIMYTSGSTGTPKGVVITHQGIVRLVCDPNYVEIGESSVVLQLAAPSFDASTFELWAPLLNGGTSVLYPGDVPSIDGLRTTIRDNGINVMWLTASLFNMIIDEAPEALQGIGQLLVGGEALSVKHVQKALNLLPGTRLINGYGPTENTTFSCCYTIPEEERGGPYRSIPIGTPISGSTVYVLDEGYNLVPVGITGEIYVGGQGLAAGYVRQERLTNEKFITVDINGCDTPQQGKIRRKLYKTGDLGRWRANGNLEYLGRLDEQVKVRGFLVEPDEVKTEIAKHPDIQNVVVIASKNGAEETRLVAYVQAVTGRDSGLADGILASFLARRLPGYMIPSTFVMVRDLPLTANGKLDIGALPQPPLRPTNMQARHQADTDELAIALAEIWRDVLQLPQAPSMDDSFFDLGGTSLDLIRAHNRIATTLPYDCSVLDLLTFPTIGTLVTYLGGKQRITDSEMAIGKRAEKRRAAQRRGRPSK